MKKAIIQAVILTIVVGLSACKGRADKNKNSEMLDSIDVANIPSMIGDSVNTIVSDSGLIMYKMKAPKLYIYDKVDTPYWDFPQGIHLTTYSKKGLEDGDIKSKFAIYYVDTELWELRKNVVAENPDGSLLETEILYWNQKEKLIYSDTVVTITEDGIRTTGTGFRTDESFEDWEMDNIVYEE